MTAQEVFGGVNGGIELDEAKPVAPMTPEQSRKRAERLAAAQAKVADAKQQAQIRIQAAQRKAADI